MKGLYFVEPIVAIYSFASFLPYPLVQQYVYRRLWQEITNTSYPVTDTSSLCATNSSNHSKHHDEVQKAASKFSMYSDIFSMIPSLLVTLVLVAYSDRRGRKVTIVLPLVGSLVYCLSFLAVSLLELSLYLLIVASFVSSLFGGVSTMLGGCFSYVADRCEDSKQKTLRMAGLDMVIGLLSGVAFLSSGYFLRATGFNWPFFTSATFQMFNLLYTLFVLEESRVVDDGSANGGGTVRRFAMGIYELFARGGRRRNGLLVLLIATFCSFSFAYFGGLSVVTLYELNEPLCWSEILVGYGSALSTAVFATSFVGVALLSRCLPSLVIVFIGMMSVCVGMAMMAFAKTTLMMFLGRVPMLPAIMPFPIIRSMMSKLVSKSEQGKRFGQTAVPELKALSALFACLAFIENLSTNMAGVAFNSIYSSTVALFPGFTFLLASGLCLVPLSLLGALRLFRMEDSSGTEGLLEGEETQAPDAPVA